MPWRTTNFHRGKRRVRHIGQVVGENDFFTKSYSEAIPSPIPVLQTFLSVMNLVCKIRIADDGAGNQLREESNVQHDIPQAFLCRFPTVHIDHIGNCLKRKEGNADWQCNLRNRKPHKRQAVQVFRKESEIFKYEEHSQIHTDRYKQETLPGTFCRRLDFTGKEPA